LVSHQSVTAWRSVTGRLSRRTSRGSVPDSPRAFVPRVVDHGRVNLVQAGERQSPHPQAVKKRLIRRNPRCSEEVGESMVKGRRIFCLQPSTFDPRPSTVAREDASAECVPHPRNPRQTLALQQLQVCARDEMKGLAFQTLMLAALRTSLPLVLVQYGKMTAESPCRRSDFARGMDLVISPLLRWFCCIRMESGGVNPVRAFRISQFTI
jgi:hypothetical protein